MKKIITIIALAFSLGANAQNIYTVAGNGTNTYSGDGGQATAAGFQAAFDVAIDNAGNMYVVDNTNNRVRMINTAGIISTFAGTGTPGYSGDGGQASLAELNIPVGVSVDGAGNVYIADGENNCIRKVNTAGIISTIAGNGTAGFMGDGGQATAAELKLPHGVTFDGAGNMYIVDQSNQRIRMVNSSGIISTVAGNGTAGFSGDGGQATDAEINYPSWICFDAAGNLYIADSNNERVRMVTTAGVISTIAGNGTQGYTGNGGQATAAEMANPAAIVADAASNLYVIESQNNIIRKINTAGIISLIAGSGPPGFSGDGGLATAAELFVPAGLALDASGNIYIADYQNKRIRVVAAPLMVSATTNTICMANSTTLTVTGATGYTWSPSTGLATNTGSLVVASPTVTTTYTVVSALYGLPIDTATITINVNSLPTVTVNSATVCAGTTTTLTANSATAISYTWTTGDNTTSITPSPTVSTNYTVTGADANNCMASAVSTVSVNTLPTVSVTVNTATVCAGTMDTLTVNGTATSYTWSTTETTASVTPSPTVTSTYTVMGTDANNCMNWATATINVNALPTLTITASAGFSVCPHTTDTLKASGTATSYTWASGATPHVVTDYTVRPNNTTTYTLTGVDANGCKNKLTQQITVYPRPTLTITPSAAPICAGDTTTLTVTTGSISITSYTWSTAANTSSISVTPPLTTTYSVIGEDAQGCTTTSHYSLTVNPLPTVTANSSTNTICINGTATLTAGGATSYIWSTNATTASIPVTLTVTTTYTVLGIDGNSCRNTAAVTQTVSTTCYESLEQVAGNNSEVTVYPNPNNGTFVVITTENTNTIVVTDILGNELVSINPNGNTATPINLSAQPSGIYFIKVTANGSQTVKRIVINN